MVHTHLHSMYSLRDSIIRPEELAERIKEIGQTAVAVTDHGMSLGGISIYKILAEHNIKYIHSCEFYICDDLNIKDKNSKYYHLVALCKNDTGRINLNRLISESGKRENFYNKPRIDFDLLCRYKDGLIITSACMAGEIGRTILNNYEESKITAEKYRKIFGEDYFLEIQSHRDEEQIKINKAVVKLAEELNIPVVVTCDAHYVLESDKKYQNKYAFGGNYKEDGEAYVDCFIQSEAEVRERLDYLPEKTVNAAIHNTDVISDRCNVEMPLSAPIMPEVSVPTGYENNVQWLEKLCKDGFRKKLHFDLDTYENTGECPLSDKEKTVYAERYKYELDSLVRMEFVDYILLVYSYAHKGKRRGIARGSGGGSLINYLTDITRIDPVVHGLYFERFIDVSALDLLEKGQITKKELKIPDIDLDFSYDSCAEVLHFLYEEYGENKVASIGKFGTNKTKGTIRDICKVFDISLEIADNIAKSFENYELDEILQMIKGEIPVESKAAEAIEIVKAYPELFEYVEKLNGLPKSFGLHACGKIISTRDLDEFLPSCYDTNGVRYLQGDMHDVEDVGLVKIDLLGLRTLDQIYDTLELCGENEDFIDPAQDYRDDKVLDIFRNGDTVGVFQFSSEGMKQVVKKMDVRGIDDLSVANALYRPGSLDYIDNFCRRRKGEEKFEYLHPDLEPILNITYGIFVFQEQIIELGRLAKIHNPDLLRKATAKKNPKLLAKVKPELEEKLKERGWTDEQFTELWAQIVEFGKYSFNKAHSSAYAIIAYMTAKLKAYYPAEFYAGLCNSYIGESDFVKNNADEIMTDMMSHGIKIAPFNFRNDHRKCSVSDGKVVYAVPLIRDCSEMSAEVLYQCSDKKYDLFTELLYDLNRKGVTSTQTDIFIKLGFFSEFGEIETLLRTKEIFLYFKYGEAKEIDKNKIPYPEIETALRKYCKETNSRYSVTNEKIENSQKLIRLLKKKQQNGIAGLETELVEQQDIAGAERRKIINKIISEIIEEMQANGSIKPISFKDRIEHQLKYLGSVYLITGKEIDRRKIFIKKMTPLKSRETGKIWGYALDTMSIGSGKNSRLTIYKNVFDTDPFGENDVIYASSVTKNPSGYWYLNDYKKIS